MTLAGEERTALHIEKFLIWTIRIVFTGWVKTWS